MIKKCERCNKEFETKTTAKRCPECKNIRICQFCGKEYIAKSRSKTCSVECSRKSIEKTKLERYGSKNFVNPEKAKKTNLEKYGVENVSQIEEIKIKKEETSLRNYGVTHYSKTTERLEKVKKTNLKKYGVEYVLQSKEKKEKAKKTNLERYGVEHYTNREKAKETMLEKYGIEQYVNPEKAKKTNLEKYGVNNPSKTETVQKKIISTNLKRYGTRSPMQNEDIQEKSKLTTLKNFGVPYSLQNKEVREKAKETMIKRYGVENPMQSEEIKKKIFSTNLKRYGSTNPYQSPKTKETMLEKYKVPYYCMTKDCRSKSKANSKINQEFSNLLKEFNIEFEEELRIDNYSYDFHITGQNILLEINPTPYHNTTWHPHNKIKNKDYHFNKTLTAKENNYQCIHIWDWDNLDKVINMLKSKETLYARNLEMKEIDKKIANEFLDKYHLQNKCNGNIVNLGLYKDNELIQLMTFGKPRYNKNYEYELLRLCTNNKYKIVGGSEKLFKFFIKNYSPKSIISYCDNSKFTGEVYERLGFTLSSYGKPSKHWYNIDTDKHITDNLLKQRGFDQLLGKEYGTFGKGTSNKDLMIENNFVEIYDCGQSTWIYSI